MAMDTHDGLWPHQLVASIYTSLQHPLPLLRGSLGSSLLGPSNIAFMSHRITSPYFRYHFPSSLLIKAGPEVISGTLSAMYNLSWFRSVPVSAADMYHETYTASGANRYAALVRVVDLQHCLGPETQLTFSVGDNMENSQAVFTKREILWIVLLPVGLFLLLFCLIALLFGQKYFHLFELKQDNTHFASCGFFYKAVNIKRGVQSRSLDNVTVITRPGAPLQYVTGDIEQLTHGFTANDYVVVIGGTNDVGKKQPNSIVNQLIEVHTFTKHTNLILATLTMRHDKPHLDEQISHINDNLMKWSTGAEAVSILSLHRLPRHFYTKHGLHLNKLGKEKICQMIVGATREMRQHRMVLEQSCIFFSERVFRRNTRNSIREWNVLYVEKEIEDAKERGEADGFEISYNRLTFQREIGRGAFGQVFLAKAEAIRGVPGSRLVAVKKLKGTAGAEEKEEFLEEISMLKKVGQHPNIVSLLACCTLNSDLCMVMEFVPCGDLLKYLRNLRQKLDARKPSITS
ncbi:hypothetical protein J6590_006215 [Homalodisca vitripennis]|nr:hypothetical protein J6590_006215 [Homalodisca vitripennis]